MSKEIKWFSCPRCGSEDFKHSDPGTYNDKDGRLRRNTKSYELAATCMDCKNKFIINKRYGYVSPQENRKVEELAEGADKAAKRSL